MDKRLASVLKSCAAIDHDVTPSAQRVREVSIKYDIPPAKYLALAVRQSGGCAICGGKSLRKKYLAVDHNHDTGEVRGLLCNNCNSGLGFFKDNAALLRLAAAYLDRHTPEGE